LVAFELVEKAVPRHGFRILDPTASYPIGAVTSGNFSPVLEQGIALAFLSPKVPFGEPLEIEVRDSRLVGEVSKPPFISLPSRPDEA